MLTGKRFIVGVTGSIAAYKAAILVRLLVKAGAEVRVVMTPLAKAFITPLTLATLSKHPILVEFFDPENGAWNSHVSLGEWADGYIVADNLLLTTYLSARCPVFVAPAMDLDMYAHAATQTNLSILRQRGCEVIEPASGELASGLEGKGRMEEPERIFEALETYYSRSQGPLSGRRFLVTAGPTREAIDPVRYISNHSTGKMGYALAAELCSRGAEVTLVSGPTQLETPRGVKRIDVETAEEMYQAASEVFERCDGAVMCAAVADYRPSLVADQKIKKGEVDWQLSLEPTRDIARALGGRKGDRLLVGFALETEQEREHALAKLQKKNLDFIVLNSLADPGAGFGVDTNRITILDREGRLKEYPLKSKAEVARDIIDYLETYFVS